MAGVGVGGVGGGGGGEQEADRRLGIAGVGHPQDPSPLPGVGCQGALRLPYCLFCFVVVVFLLFLV